MPSQSVEALSQLVAKIGSVYADVITQNKFYTNILAEHVFSLYQQLYIIDDDNAIPASKIASLVRTVHEAAQYLVQLLSEDPRHKRKMDKQNEYVFDRETSDVIEKLKKHIDYIRDATHSVNINAKQVTDEVGQRIDLLHVPAKYAGSSQGVFVYDELCNNLQTFHIHGFEPFTGRFQLFNKCLQRLENSQERLKVMVVHGNVGLGKTALAIRFCRALAERFEAKQVLHIRVRANTEYPLTTGEIMQQCVRLWNGSFVKKEDELRKTYYKVFMGKTNIVFIDDPVNTKQVLELLPRTNEGQTKAIVVVTSSNTLNLDLFTQGQVDAINAQGIEEKKTKQVEEDHDEFEEDDVAIDDKQDDDDEEKKAAFKLQSQNEVEEIFNTSKRKPVTVVLHSTEDDDDDLSKVKYPKIFHCVLCGIDKLAITDTTKAIQLINPSLNDDDACALAVLTENTPIFSRVAARTQHKYSGMTVDQFVQHMSSRLDVQAESGLSQMKVLCHGIFVGCYDKFPIVMQQFILRLTVFPNEFDPVSAALITETNLAMTLEFLAQFVKMGIVQVCPYSLRFCLHDLVRETFAAYVSDYLGGEVQESVEECKQRMLQHYFDLMDKFNFEHKFSGIAVTPGYEQYDLELENMKAVMNFMQEDEKNHIDCVNRSRYLIADRVFAIKRGVLYQKLIGNVDKCENEYHKADFLEGFALVYFDLTDYNKAYTQAKRSFEIKENAFVLSEKPTDELELLCVLKLLGDLTSTTRAYDHAKKYYERIISVATKHAQEWQKLKMEKKDGEGEGYDDNEFVILDPFLAHAQSNLAVIALYANDFKTGRKLFNRAVTVLKRIYGTVHPEISKAYAGYANILKQFKNVRQFYDEINALFKEAIEIDTKLFSSNSVLVVERMDDYGVSLLGQSKFAEAEKLFRQTLDARKALLGGNVIDLTLSATMNNLAVALKNQGKYVEAESFYEQSLQMLVELLGDKHYQVSVAKANLAHVYASNNKGDKSEKLYMEAFDALQNSTEPGNDEVMAAMLNNMGDAARLRKEFDKAIEYYQHALAIRKKLSTDLANDPEIAKTLSSIAKLYFDKGENKQALELQEQALGVIEKQVGKNHPQYAAGITNIANMYFKEQKYKEAEQYFTEALNIRRQLKEEDVKLVAVVQSLAVTLEKQKRYRDAEVLFRDVLVITESNQLGEDKMLSVINSIAACLSHQKNFPEAEKYYTKAQQLILKESGEESMQNADVLCNIGAVQLSQDNYDDAENAFAKALTIYESNYGPDHEKVVNLQEHLSEIRQLIYQRDRANKCCIVA